MMKEHQLLVVVCLCIALLLAGILVSLSSDDATESIVLPDGCVARIELEHTWEPYDLYLYLIECDGQMVVDPFVIDSVPSGKGDERSYSIVQDNRHSVVAILEESSPFRVFALYDYSTRETWPACARDVELGSCSIQGNKLLAIFNEHQDEKGAYRLGGFE